MLFACLFAVVVLASTVECNLHLLKVFLPPRPGRVDTNDFKKIDDILDKAAEDADVEVILATKATGNPLVYAVLKIDDNCKMDQLTSKLAALGYMYRANPIYSCLDFAEELNVTLTVNNNLDIKHLALLKFPVHGLTEVAYNEEVAGFLKHVNTRFAQSGWDMTCFREDIEIPYKLIFFTNEPDSADFDLATDMKAAEQFEVRLRLVQNLDTYMSACDA